MIHHATLVKHAHVELGATNLDNFLLGETYVGDATIAKIGVGKVDKCVSTGYGLHTGVVKPKDSRLKVASIARFGSPPLELGKPTPLSTFEHNLPFFGTLQTPRGVEVLQEACKFLSREPTVP
jgi:hypothetical protein